jgi:hypothetical protein
MMVETGEGGWSRLEEEGGRRPTVEGLAEKSRKIKGGE